MVAITCTFWTQWKFDRSLGNYHIICGMRITNPSLRSNSMPIPCHSPESTPSQARRQISQGTCSCHYWASHKAAWAETMICRREECLTWRVAVLDELALTLQMNTVSVEEEAAFICSGPPGCTQLISHRGGRWSPGNELWAPGSGRVWLEGQGLGSQLASGFQGEKVRMSLTFFESWSPYVKIGNK